MERLTEYNEEFDHYFYNKDFNKATDKLGKLEDLEKQIGMSLEALVKILFGNIDNIYIIENYKIIRCCFSLLEREQIWLADRSEKDRLYSLDLKDFNRKWFLTCEEARSFLENIYEEIDKNLNNKGE